MDEMPMMDALVMASAFSMFGRKRAMQDPERAVKIKERKAAEAEAAYDRQYTQAHLDHEEYLRSPRSFMRRLTRTTRSKDQTP